MTAQQRESRTRRWAARLKTETSAVYLACRDPRTPWYAKALAILVVGYALSPTDLIPDFIPVLGYLDDIVIVPAGFALAIKLIPSEVLDDSRARAVEAGAGEASVNRAAAVIVVTIWVLLLGLAVFLIVRAF